MLGDSRHERYDKRDEELERLCRLVRDLELEARGRRWRRNHEEHAEGSASMGGVVMERHPINLIFVDTKIGLGNMQIETRFP